MQFWDGRAATLEEQTGHQIILSLHAENAEGLPVTRETVEALLQGFRWQQRLLHVHGADHDHVLIADIAVPTYHVWQQLNAYVRSRAAALGLQNVMTDVQS